MLENKVGMIFGVANKRSIAWACAESCLKQGAKLAFTYQGERLRENVEKLTKELPETLVVPCDVTNQQEVDAAFAAVGAKYGKLDFLIHSIAFAPREALEGEFLTTTREAFLTAMEISAFSLPQLALAALPYMNEGGSIVCMSYYGAEKVVQNYNVMGVAKAALEASVRYLASDLGPSGVRVNAISAGPIKTLAASGIKGFRGILGFAAEKAPLRRNITLEDVAGAAVFLCSDLSAGMTGEVIHVDAGYNILGL